MKIGLFLTNQQHLGTDMVKALDEQIRMARHARDHGWDSLFSGQHYLNEGNNQQLQIVPFLARLIPEAGEMEIGLGVLLLNLHNPVYTAETVASLDVISRGVSGRVGILRLTGRDGQQVDVEGLPIRWLLDLPDTLFTAERTMSRGGEKGWLFSGRGWGHGVGMCQIGAFGMARRGHRYDDILDHYYSGLELKKLAPAGPRHPAP